MSSKPTNHHKRKKRQLLERDGLRIDDKDGYQIAVQYRCYLCRTILPEYELEIEHKVPKARGGTDALSNLGLACEPCNSAKANMTVEEYLEWRELPLKVRIPSLKYQGRRRLNKAKAGLTHALSDYWPEQEDKASPGAEGIH